MKTVTFLLMVIVSTNSFSLAPQTHANGFYPDGVIDIHRERILLQDVRMIAGNYDSKKKQNRKMSFSESLRRKLKNSPGVYSF